MEISKQKKRKISIVASLIVIAIIVILIISNTMKQSRVVNNEKLLAKLTIGNIRLLMTEEDFVQIAGQGDVEEQIYALDNIRIRLMVDSDSTIQKIVLSVVDKLPKNITR